MEEDYNWKHDVKDWNKISDKSAQLILSLSETSLKESVETAKLISQRTDKLLAIVIPVLTFALGFLFKEGFNNLFKDFLILTAVLAVILLSISLIF